MGAKCSCRLTRNAFVRLHHSYVQSPCVHLCLSCDEHLKHKDNGRPSGHLHSDAQVNTRARKHQKLYTLALVCVTVQEDSPLPSLITYYLYTEN